MYKGKLYLRQFSFIRKPIFRTMCDYVNIGSETMVLNEIGSTNNVQKEEQLDATNTPSVFIRLRTDMIFRNKLNQTLALS